MGFELKPSIHILTQICFELPNVTNVSNVRKYAQQIRRVYFVNDGGNGGEAKECKRIKETSIAEQVILTAEQTFRHLSGPTYATVTSKAYD